MLNYAVDPEVFRGLVPRGTELDEYNGVTYASVVGFRFLNTRVLGLGIPFHRDFDEVNLRFYVRRKVAGVWRRGVVFVRELVPRLAIALVARVVYGEPYSRVRMRHRIMESDGKIETEYAWRRGGRWERLFVAGTGEALEIEAGSEEEFITEHYWGYTDRRGRSSEYKVEHPRWRVWRAKGARLEADIAGLYGERFVEGLSRAPSSAFIAEGSEVRVRYWSDPRQG
jgi:uncharacterized protein YqjF (DUF2071 family)